MRHRVHGKKLGRSTQHRLALRRNLARSLFLEFGESGHILTTREKAKYVQPFVEKLISLGREKTLHRYRRGLRLLGDEDMVHRLFHEIGPAYRDRPGGYTRVVRTGRRRLGDRATEVYFGFVTDEPAGGAGDVTVEGATADAADNGVAGSEGDRAGD